jgi:hypothetical protein
MSPGGRCQRDPGAEVPTARGGVRHLNPQRLVASLVPQRKCTNCLIEQATTRRVMCYSRAKKCSVTGLYLSAMTEPCDVTQLSS